jgi:hypothetical protein
MGSVVHPWGSPVGEETHDYDELRALYAAYRRRQARGLLAMLPREAIRPLYRAALEGTSDASLADDPLQLLVAYCERLLPLPPFEMWAGDLADHPDAHLSEWDDAADWATSAHPVSLAIRSVRCLGQLWRVRLRGYREHGAWRGFMAFDGAALTDTHRTAVVFREATPTALRDRFLAFEPHAIEAFLRSCLP